MSNPFFSVIIPTHNGEERIGRAVASVTMQTFTDYELIVVCDSCTDDTAKYVKNLFYDNLGGVNIIFTDCNTEGGARNAGLDVATGDWILWLDDDDWFIHEYCFEMIVNEINVHAHPDVLCFSYIWKGKGVIPPHLQDNVMVWTRAWRRSFIGDMRFNDAEYGTDKDFWTAMQEKHPDMWIAYLDTPIVYYNYMLPGCMTEQHKKTISLDIIVTHKNEPWNICRPFFDMIENQRIADRDDFTVTIVQDGQNTLPFDILLKDYSFSWQIVQSDGNGTPAARNTGYEHTNGSWVMFCDIDDMFADVSALQQILANFPVTDYDVLWGKYTEESRWNASGKFMNCVSESNFCNTTCKLYRRAFLDENNIFFDNRFPIHYEYAFNALCLAYTQPFRIAMVVSDFYMYCKTLRSNSLRHEPDFQRMRISTLWHRDASLAGIFQSRGLDIEYRKAVARTIADEYYTVYRPGETWTPAVDSSDKHDFYAEHIDAYKHIPVSEIEIINGETETEYMNLMQEMYNDFLIENYFKNEDTPFINWLASQSWYVPSENTQPANTTQQEQDTVAIPVSEPQNYEPHVAVYCGTYNTYMNMLTSAKSLLWHTPMDKIYFLIEDDTFPYELPDIIETINVKNQSFFPHDGPNYNNAWSYMCMMRAAFSKLIPYDKILSLDIDVVIQEDISPLWDVDMTNHYLAGVPEPGRQKSATDPIYINFGVVMMNLAEIRNDHIDDQAIAMLNTTRLGCPEQDAFNRICAGRIIPLSNDYNATVHSHITGDAEHERIIHYAGIRFWRHYGQVKEYAQRKWDDIMERQRDLHA